MHIHRMNKIQVHAIVNDNTLDVMYPHLQPGERVHIVINHDEMSVATNEQQRRLWLLKANSL